MDFLRRAGKFIVDAYIGCFMVGGFLILMGTACSIFIFLALTPVWLPYLVWRLW